MAFALFFLAEYINMIVISALAATLFLGGWDAPFEFLSFIPGIFWLVLKVFALLSVFIWVRATFRASVTTRSCASAGRCSCLSR